MLLRSGALYVNEIDVAILIKISNLAHLAMEKGNAFENKKSAYATSILFADSALGTLVGKVVCLLICVNLLDALVTKPSTLLCLLGAVKEDTFMLMYVVDTVDAAMGTSSASGMDETLP